jgi:hypothetical protein
MFCFYAYGQISQKLKKNHHIVFSYNKENFKKYVLAYILALITSLLKPRELGQYFKNSEKNYFVFSFNIWGYNLIHKTYSGFKFFC